MKIQIQSSKEKLQHFKLEKAAIFLYKTLQKLEHGIKLSGQIRNISNSKNIKLPQYKTFQLLEHKQTLT